MSVDDQVVGEIGRGIAVLVAVHSDDTPADIAWIANKLTGLRLFPRDGKNFDQSVQDIAGGILLVSNFTVAGNVQTGRRPSFDVAAKADAGKASFDQLFATLSLTGLPVAAGIFGADMQVDISNDGPVTIIVDSRASRR